MTSSKFKVGPRPRVDEAAVKAFLDGADAETRHNSTPVTPSTRTPSNTATEWAKLDNQRRIPSFPMRFTDLERAQLNAVTKGGKSPSMHQYCLDAIKAAIEADLKKGEQAHHVI